MTKLQALLYAIAALALLAVALGVCAAAKEHALAMCKMTSTERACEQWLEGDGL